MVTALVSNVTAPVRAKALPEREAPVVSVMEVWASMFPENEEPVPRVAEVPTSQKTLAGRQLRRFTLLPLAVVSVLPIWKMI
jgi:hypothetical protein